VWRPRISLLLLLQGCRPDARKRVALPARCYLVVVSRRNLSRTSSFVCGRLGAGAVGNYINTEPSYITSELTEQRPSRNEKVATQKLACSRASSLRCLCLSLPTAWSHGRLLHPMSRRTQWLAQKELEKQTWGLKLPTLYFLRPCS